MSDLFGYVGMVLAMAVSVPQLFNVRRVSLTTYFLLCGTHLAYGTAALLNGLPWLFAASAWGLVVAGLVIWRLRNDNRTA